MNSFLLKNNLGIGDSFPIRINCNFGINKIEDEKKEKGKISQLLSTKEYRPDITMDLSTIQIPSTIYEFIISNFQIPVGTVPAYFVFKKEHGIDKSSIIEIINRQAEVGVAFFTLHFTAELDLYQKAIKIRKIPITSRGGGLLLSDQLLNKRKENILIENIDEIIQVCKKNNVAISVGTTFRPACISDACDEVHLGETKRQLEVVRYLRKNGINTIVENSGHISLDRLYKHTKLLLKFNSPIMPLGPLPTDIAFENDHIASSIGAAFLSYWGCAQIINSITPNEHTKSYLDLESTKQGIAAARITSHIINLMKYPDYWRHDDEVSTFRALKKSCIIDNDSCERCSNQCPLKNL